MNTAERLEMLDWILHLKDDVLIQKLRAIKAETRPNLQDEVGYTVLGEPMTRDQYNAKLEQGENDIDEGRFTTQEDLRKEMESW